MASWLVAAVLAFAAGTAAWWLARDPAMALPATVAVLIVTCPCALALASPVALALTAGRFAALGMIPTRGGAFERLASADTAVFDKTGTLTAGTPMLERVETAGSLTREQALAVAASLEGDSTHPVARSIVAASPERCPPPTNGTMHPVAASPEPSKARAGGSAHPTSPSTARHFPKASPPPCLERARKGSSQRS